MSLRMIIGLLIAAMIVTIPVACITEKDTSSDVEQIVKLINTYAQSMDELDKETWLSVFSDDLVSYAVYPYGSSAPLIHFPDPDESGTTKEQLADMCDMMIFERVEVGQSFLSNIIVDVQGDSAAGMDYFRHWEIIDPTHIANIARGMDGDHWYFQEGKHEHEFTKEDGEWKITKFKGTLYRTEARERQDI
jgi:hypothetical protein